MTAETVARRARRPGAGGEWLCWVAAAQGVGIIGLFSDWPATVTTYANCMGLEGGRRGGDHDDDD